jgi:hypothetical protein
MMKKIRTKSKALDGLPEPQRGPQGMKPVSLTERDVNEPADPPVDLGMLDRIRGRLIKKSPFAEPVLGLEILEGPYQGVVFTFTKFSMLPGKNENGLIPTRYETDILIAPEGFDKTEAFDSYTTEIVLAWLNYLHTHDLAPLIKAKPLGRYGIQ